MDAIYTGTIFEMLSALHAEHLQTKRCELGLQSSVWVTYAGNDCAPFNIYLRLERDRITIANIFAHSREREEPVVRKGRIPLIVAAAMQVVPKVRIESVINPNLKQHLENTGFIEDAYTSSYEKENTGNEEP